MKASRVGSSSSLNYFSHCGRNPFCNEFKALGRAPKSNFPAPDASPDAHKGALEETQSLAGTSRRSQMSESFAPVR